MHVLRSVSLAFAVGAIALVTAGCGAEPVSSPAQGGSGEACLADGSCEQGLSCLDNLCVPHVSADVAADTSAALSAG